MPGCLAQLNFQEKFAVPLCIPPLHLERVPFLAKRCPGWHARLRSQDAPGGPFCTQQSLHPCGLCAEERWRDCIALLPDQAEPQYKLGLITARLRRREALFHLERAVSLDPESTEFLQRLGVQYERERQPDLAITTFRKVLAMDPTHEDARIAILRINGSQV